MRKYLAALFAAAALTAGAAPAVLSVMTAAPAAVASAPAAHPDMYHD
jgi:hypothetical protein